MSATYVCMVLSVCVNIDLAPQYCLYLYSLLFLVAARRNDVEHCRFVLNVWLLNVFFHGELVTLREIQIIRAIFVYFSFLFFGSCYSSEIVDYVQFYQDCHENHSTNMEIDAKNTKYVLSVYSTRSHTL